MPAVNYDLMLQEMLTKTRGQGEPDHLLGPAARLAEPDAHAQSRHDLFHGVLQHQGCRADRDRIPAGGRRRLAQRQHRQRLAAAARGCGPARRRQGQGRQVPDPAAGLRGAGPGRAMSRCSRAPSAATRCSARTSKATATPTSRSRSPMASASRSIRCRRPPIRRRRCSPTSRTSCSTRPSATTELLRQLDRIVQSEPWLDRDRAMIDQLRSLGIEKGKPFAPDAATKQALANGIREAQAWLEAKIRAGLPPFFEGTHWTFPAPPGLHQGGEPPTSTTRTPIRSTARGLAYHYAYHRHQAAGRRPVLPDQHQGQGRRKLRRRQEPIADACRRTRRSSSTGR